MSNGLSEKSLREWMTRLGPSLLNLSHGICHDRHRAEEVVQEAFVRLWRQPPTGGEAAYAAWMRRVVTNLSINVLKRIRRPGALPEHGTDRSLQSHQAPEAQTHTSEELSRLARALARLDEPKRAILLLRGQEEMSYEAIATHLGVPVGTVMSRLNRARTALMEELERLDRAGAESDQSDPERRATGDSPGADPKTFDIRRYRQA